MNFRKGILAAATAVAVATSGVATAEAAENSATPTATSKAAPTTTPKKETPKVSKTTTPTDKSSSGDESSSIKDMRPAEIRDWIAVFTAVIGALGTLFAFLDKHLRK